MIISQLLESSSSSSASLFLLLFLELELDFSYRILHACICNLRFERIRGASSDPPIFTTTTSQHRCSGCHHGAPPNKIHGSTCWCCHVLPAQPSLLESRLHPGTPPVLGAGGLPMVAEMAR